MKTMIFWLRKRARKPKMVGLATADHSVLTISDYAAMAHRGDGKLFIVDSENAETGRKAIARFRSGDSSGWPMHAVKGPVVALGAQACLALGGTNKGRALWDHRIASQGRVKIRQAGALSPDNFPHAFDILD